MSTEDVEKSDKAKLVSKLVRVMSSVKRIAKNGRNTFHNYDYVTEADVMEAMRDELAKENLFVLSSVEQSHKEADTVSVSMKHTFIDADTGEQIEVKSLGVGQDKGDKAANKAVTAAVKYMLLKNFMISTGDDSEATDENGKRVSVLKSVAGTKTDTAKDPVKKYSFAAKTPKATAPPADSKLEATDESEEVKPPEASALDQASYDFKTNNEFVRKNADRISKNGLARILKGIVEFPLGDKDAKISDDVERKVFMAAALALIAKNKMMTEVIREQLVNKEKEKFNGQEEA